MNTVRLKQKKSSVQLGNRITSNWFLHASRSQPIEEDENGKMILHYVDKDGNLCPTDMRLVKFKVKGAGSYKASANGDPTCLDLFHLPQMHAFNGMLTAIVQSGKEAGVLELQVTAKGLKSGKIQIEVK